VKWLSLCLLAAMLASWLQPATASALTPDDLLHQGRLQVASSLSPEQNIVPGQKLRLTLEIATDRWFTGGTRISVPEVPGLVILQTEQFASNASENRGGQSWVVQRWTLDVYAQRAGDFSIPPIALQVRVNAGDSSEVAGRLDSPPVRFSAQIPELLAQAKSWVAAPDFSVRQYFDRSLDGLQVGEALEREIVFEGSDVMAMMLPSFASEELPGLAAYPEPPVLEDNSNRGEMRARRTERISYVIESEGRYLLPALDFNWWNTQTGELQIVSVPATEILAGSPGEVSTDARQATDRLSTRQRVLLLTALGSLLVAAWAAYVLLPGLPLGRYRAWLKLQWRRLADLRKPALPERLNPGSSAAE
jgi:hypothetical protein